MANAATALTWKGPDTSIHRGPAPPQQKSHFGFSGYVTDHQNASRDYIEPHKPVVKKGSAEARNIKANHLLGRDAAKDHWMSHQSHSPHPFDPPLPAYDKPSNFEADAIRPRAGPPTPPRGSISPRYDEILRNSPIPTPKLANYGRSSVPLGPPPGISPLPPQHNDKGMIKPNVDELTHTMKTDIDRRREMQDRANAEHNLIESSRRKQEEAWTKFEDQKMNKERLETYFPWGKQGGGGPRGDNRKKLLTEEEESIKDKKRRDREFYRTGIHDNYRNRGGESYRSNMPALPDSYAPYTDRPSYSQGRDRTDAEDLRRRIKEQEKEIMMAKYPQTERARSDPERWIHERYANRSGLGWYGKYHYDGPYHYKGPYNYRGPYYYIYKPYEFDENQDGQLDLRRRDEPLRQEYQAYKDSLDFEPFTHKSYGSKLKQSPDVGTSTHVDSYRFHGGGRGEAPNPIKTAHVASTLPMGNIGGGAPRKDRLGYPSIKMTGAMNDIIGPREYQEFMKKRDSQREQREILGMQVKMNEERRERELREMKAPPLSTGEFIRDERKTVMQPNYWNRQYYGLKHAASSPRHRFEPAPGEIQAQRQYKWELDQQVLSRNKNEKVQLEDSKRQDQQHKLKMDSYFGRWGGGAPNGNFNQYANFEEVLFKNKERNQDDYIKTRLESPSKDYSQHPRQTIPSDHRNLFDYPADVPLKFDERKAPPFALEQRYD